MLKSKKAFSLVELLLALAIIGVVAVLTISVLTSKVFGKDRAVRIKKAYTTLSNSYRYIVPVMGGIMDWPEINAAAVGENLSKNMYQATNCGTDVLQRNNDCIPDCPDIYKADGDPINTCESAEVSKFRAADGFSYAFQIEDPTCRISVLDEDSQDKDSVLKNICGTALVDIYSGSKGSNYYGADLYLFYITKDGIFPVGLTSDSKYPLDEEKCSQKTTEDVIGCSAKLIYDDDIKED